MREKFHARFGPMRTGAVRLEGVSDRDFEKIVYSRIIASVAEQGLREVTRVDLTPQSADRGRDVTVRGFTGTSFLGFEYSVGETRNLVVECKLARSRRLALGHAAANVLQLERLESATFILVTNATLTPRALTLIQDQCEQRGARFRLIDAYNFERHLPGIATSGGEAPATEAAAGLHVPLQISYQVFPLVESEGPGFIVHVVVRSFGHVPIDVEVSLHSTRQWSRVGDVIPPRQLYGDDLACFTLRLLPNGPRVPERAKLLLRIDGAPEFLDLQVASNENFVDLPLFGAWITETLDTYERRLREGQAPRVVHLHGPSGTGKTRYLAEIAKRMDSLGREVMWYRLRDDGTALTVALGSGRAGQKRPRSITQRELIRAAETHAQQTSPRVVIIDDLHVATAETLHLLEPLVFTPEGPELVLAGRSDPLSRQPRYEAFTRIFAENAVPATHEQVIFGDLPYSEVTEILGTLMPGLTLGSFSARKTALRPVDLVHYVYSLLERGFIYWADENRLAAHPGRADDGEGDAFASGTGAEILQYRFEHLDGVLLGDFTLADLFTLMALADNADLTFRVLGRLRSERELSEDLLQYWFEEDPAAGMALLAHDTIREFLTRRFYGFDMRRTYGSVLQGFPELAGALNPRQLAAVHLHAADAPAAVPALAQVARAVRPVRNISALSLEEVAYNDLNSLIYLLINRNGGCRTLLCRVMIARAYQNIHERDFVDGLLDCIRLLGIIDGLPSASGAQVTRLAIRQLLAHGLLNSGDLRTALTLMHDVENSLREIQSSRTAAAVEFDMCDRLQSFYAQQSAFNLARSFMLRGRAGAHRSGDQALINLSLSAEFHLHRYLDLGEALQMAVRQVRHANEFAPPRQVLHAAVNEAVARWALHGAAAPRGTIELLEEVRGRCERSGFGHLVPRVAYLKAVDAFHREEQGSGTAGQFDELIAATKRASLRYGYGEYVWLSDNLRLLRLISAGARPGLIVELAERLVDELARNGLAFLAGKHLCNQNVVVLSNALRALYSYTDEARTWEVSRRISFSPLVCSSVETREHLVREAFAGRLLCSVHDEQAVVQSKQGYFTILV